MEVTTNGEVKKKYMLKICKCGRVEKYGNFIKPSLVDLEAIKSHWEDIKFVQKICDICKSI